MCGIYIQLFRERLCYKQRKAYATIPKVFMGNGSFYGCFALLCFLRLIEPQGVSVWWKEIAQTRVFLVFRSLLPSHLEPQSSKIKLSLPTMPIGIAAFSFTLFQDNLCPNSCICATTILNASRMHRDVRKTCETKTQSQTHWGSVSGQLCTYPSPNPTVTLTY